MPDPKESASTGTQTEAPESKGLEEESGTVLATQTAWTQTQAPESQGLEEPGIVPVPVPTQTTWTQAPEETVLPFLEARLCLNLPSSSSDHRVFGPKPSYSLWTKDTEVQAEVQTSQTETQTRPAAEGDRVYHGIDQATQTLRDEDPTLRQLREQALAAMPPQEPAQQPPPESVQVVEVVPEGSGAVLDEGEGMDALIEFEVSKHHSKMSAMSYEY